MKQSVLATVAFLFFTIGLHAQNQFSLKIDTAKTGLLGFNKQDRWPLTLKSSPESEYPAQIFQELPEIVHHEHAKATEWNMPVHEPKGHHTMPVHVPDSTINHSMIIVRPENN